MTFAEKILRFNSSLTLDNAILPERIKVLNPFKGENAGLINRLTTAFYTKFYNDNNQRKLILGINPGRLGAGATGIPFSDTKRLSVDCGIPVTEIKTHEPSSVFVYEMIDAYGGTEQFYNDYFISSVSPLGFVTLGKNGRHVNYNYYDRKDLEEAILPFIIKTLRQQIDFGLETEVCYCLGTGKNYKFLKKLNESHSFFGKIVPLEHPRYIMQYRSKMKKEYIEKYVRVLGT
jgi:hypothetical protein